MKSYTRLTREERYQLEVLLRRGLSLREIGRELGRPASTYSRERRRQKDVSRYSAEEAHERCLQHRHAWRLAQRKIQGELERKLREMVAEEKYSPEQIAGVLNQLAQETVISHHTLYRWIEEDRQQGGELYKHLTYLKKESRRSKKSKKSASIRQPEMFRRRTPIEERPKIVLKRNRLGDYERDILQGTHNGSVLLTINDRATGKLWMKWLPSKQCDLVHRATVKLLKNEIVHTITNDNGLEFARFEDTEKALGCKIYFCKPYCAGQRGSNENLNGLIRQFFPKKKDIGHPSPNRVNRVIELLNTRPRKRYDFLCPLEMEAKMKGKKRHRFNLLRWS